MNENIEQQGREMIAKIAAILGDLHKAGAFSGFALVIERESDTDDEIHNEVVACCPFHMVDMVDVSIAAASKDKAVQAAMALRMLRDINKLESQAVSRRLTGTAYEGFRQDVPAPTQEVSEEAREASPGPSEWTQEAYDRWFNGVEADFRAGYESRESEDGTGQYL